VPLNFGVSARLGRDTPFFVIEADEYDTAFCDKRSKFVHYRPRTAVLNNLEFDHADIFADLAAIETQFHHLVRTLPRSGLIVSQRRRGTSERVLSRGTAGRRWNASTTAGWRSPKVSDADGSLRLFNGKELIGETSWALTGEHNRSQRRRRPARRPPRWRAADKGLEALSRFANVKRRMELRGGGRGHGLRRFRPSPDGDHDDRRRPASASRRQPDSGGAGAALEHHEAGRDEGSVAGQPGEADASSATAPNSAGMPPPPWHRYGRQRLRSKTISDRLVERILPPRLAQAIRCW
jgi:hypothetical protein